MIDSAHFRVHRQSAASLVWQPTDSQGELVTAAGTTPTAVVTDAQGETVTVAGSATLAGATVTLALTAAETADVDRWSVAWSLDGVARGSSTVDIVGGVYLTVAEARIYEPSLTDATEFPVATLQRARREVEPRFERAVPLVGFVPRFNVYQFLGDGMPYARLPHRDVTAIRWARYWRDGEWVPLDVTGARTDQSGLLELATPDWFRCGYRCEVGYVYGMVAPPEDVKRAAALAVRYQVLQNRSGIDSRAMSYQPSEGGNVVLATAGVGPWEFGVPDIDGVLRSYRERTNRALVG